MILNMKKITIFTFVFAFIVHSINAQPKKDKALFREFKAGFYQNFIMKDVNAVNEILKPEEKEKKFMMDHTGLNLPNKIDLYKKSWAQPTLSQGNAGTCWSFSTTSFYESEVKRLTGKEVKLSEIYSAYWEYVEKAKRFVEKRGDSKFAEGSEGNALSRLWKVYGVVPNSAYTGLINGRKYHTHEAMVTEMTAFLNSLKQNNTWNEEFVVSTIKSIMNHHIGEPPAKFTVDGKEYTPQSYLKDYLQINPDDYVEILSYKQEAYWQKVEYKVPDNWWHSKDYYNVPLDDFMKALKQAIRQGYTMSIGGDVSEAGFSRETNCAIIPTFDIPSEYIDEDARQFRFSNETTTDDHGMHLIGYYEKDGKDWFLIKDSSSGSRNIDLNAPEFGYYFFHEDFIKLKMMGFTIHKDAVKELLKKF
jgi:bleomycin hydrolase